MLPKEYEMGKKAWLSTEVPQAALLKILREGLPKLPNKRVRDGKWVFSLLTLGIA
jgi:hypothetical protein